MTLFSLFQRMEEIICSSFVGIQKCRIFLTERPRDQEYIDTREDVLLFVSDPLDEALAITGRITATLFVSSDKQV